MIDPVHVRRFAVFAALGVLNTAVGYGLYALSLLVVGLAPQPALGVSFALGVLWNYVTTARFVFQVSGFRRLPAYVLCYLSVYGLNAAALKVAIDAGVAPLLAQAILLPFAAVLTFVAVSAALTCRRPNVRGLPDAAVDQSATRSR